MKIKLCLYSVFILFLLNACGSASTVKSSYIHAFIDSLAINKTQNIIIYTINPNDCLSCLNGFKMVDAHLEKTEHSRIYVISIERMIEKASFEKELSELGIKDTIGKKLLWDKELFDGINHSVNKSLPISMVCIYNYTADSTIYSKPIREIVDEKEFKSFLKKNIFR